MDRRYSWCICVLIVFGAAAALAGQPVDAQFTVTTGTGDSTTVRLGIAASATAGIDAALGEEEIPPAPPPEVFDLRLIDPDTARAALGEGAWVDVRAGDTTASAVTEHLLVCRCASSAPLTLRWTLDPGVVAVIAQRDVSPVQRRTATGTGSMMVTEHGQVCAWSITLHHHVRALTARMFLEGAFDTGTGRMRTTLQDAGILAARFPGREIPPEAVDSMAIEVRDAVSGGDGVPLMAMPAWTCADGTVRPFSPPFDIPLLFPDTDHRAWDVTFVHRNHRRATCAQPVAAGTTMFVCDMTSHADLYAGGEAATLAPGIYGMIAGDVNGDRRSDASDCAAIRQGIGRAHAYVFQDTDLNGGVGATDLALVRRVMSTNTQEP